MEGWAVTPHSPWPFEWLRHKSIGDAPVKDCDPPRARPLPFVRVPTRLSALASALGLIIVPDTHTALGARVSCRNGVQVLTTYHGDHAYTFDITAAGDAHNVLLLPPAGSHGAAGASRAAAAAAEGGMGDAGEPAEQQQQGSWGPWGRWNAPRSGSGSGGGGASSSR